MFSTTIIFTTFTRISRLQTLINVYSHAMFHIIIPTDFIAFYHVSSIQGLQQIIDQMMVDKKKFHKNSRSYTLWIHCGQYMGYMCECIDTIKNPNVIHDPNLSKNFISYARQRGAQMITYEKLLLMSYPINDVCIKNQ